MSALRILVLSVGVAVAVSTVACAAPSQDGAVQGESAFREDTAADLDVPTFAGDSLAGRYGGRMRVSYGDAAFDELAEDAVHVPIALQPERRPYTLWVDQGARGRLVVELGKQSEPLRVGTYACADADARIRLANPDGSSSVDASACRIVVDEILDRQLPGALRVLGRFEATTDPASRFAADRVRGAFVADMPRTE